jgi:4,5-dihydroxyphthalate decarboxylase
MNQLQLTLALSDYHHTRDLTRGRIAPEGIRLIGLELQIEEIFHRFTRYREWDVSEMSFGKYSSMRSQGDDSIAALPVFPSRVFRLSSIYVRRGSDLRSLERLRGHRVGVPEWAQTAAIYSRGYLAHQAGLKLDEIRWFQAGVNQPGRAEKVALRLPPEVSLTPVRDQSLNAMLLAGELDAVMSAHPPRAFEDGSGNIVRLLPDFMQREEEYWRATGVFPIMHVIAIKAEIVRAHPWVASSLYAAFERAKQASIERLSVDDSSPIPALYVSDSIDVSGRMFGRDYWPYGIDPNRSTLEAFLRYAYEQGTCHRMLTPEEIFLDPGK